MDQKGIKYYFLGIGGIGMSSLAKYLFDKGSMIGLNAELLKQYVEWIATKRLKAIGMKSPYNTPAANPLPWTQKWIAGGSVQVAPQETEISSYIVGLSLIHI